MITPTSSWRCALTTSTVAYRVNNYCVQTGHAYRCFCSPDVLAAKREKLARSGSNNTYDKACLNLTEEEVARRVRAGEKSVVRLNVCDTTVCPSEYHSSRTSG